MDLLWELNHQVLRMNRQGSSNYELIPFYLLGLLLRTVSPICFSILQEEYHLLDYFFLLHELTPSLLLFCCHFFHIPTPSY